MGEVFWGFRWAILKDRIKGPNQRESDYMVHVFVKSGDVDGALRVLKKKLSEDGDQKRLKQRKRFMPQNEQRRRKAAKTLRRQRTQYGS